MFVPVEDLNRNFAKIIDNFDYLNKRIDLIELRMKSWREQMGGRETCKDCGQEIEEFLLSNYCALCHEWHLRQFTRKLLRDIEASDKTDEA